MLPVAEEALGQNQAKGKEIEKALSSLGLKDKARLTPNRIGSAGPPYYGGNPRPQTVSGYDASQYLYIFFTADDLKDREGFERKVAGAIDGLRKAGAGVVDTPANRVCQGQMLCSVAYALKDASAVHDRLMPEALRNGRALAEQTARELGTRLGRLRSVSIGGQQYSSPAGLNGQSGPLDDLSFDYLSSSETIPITVSAGLVYDIQDKK
ncbi:MAG: SIMPL domain-containing protein [Acidobacteriota bacterium]|nr:SIMPL domain-containing protein [Acidobacteriota bacterium]